MRNKIRHKTRFHENVHVKVNGSIKAGMSICYHTPPFAENKENHL